MNELVTLAARLSPEQADFAVLCTRVITGTATDAERATVESVASADDSAPNYRKAARIALGLE